MAALDQSFVATDPLRDEAPSSVRAMNVVAATATPKPAILSAPIGSGGLVVVVEVTTASGTGVTFTIEGVDRASNKTWVILTSTAKTTAATTVLRVSPNITAAANLIAQDLIPSEVIIRAAHSDGAALTYTVGVHFTD